MTNFYDKFLWHFFVLVLLISNNEYLHYDHRDDSMLQSHLQHQYWKKHGTSCWIIHTLSMQMNCDSLRYLEKFEQKIWRSALCDYSYNNNQWSCCKHRLSCFGNRISYCKRKWHCTSQAYFELKNYEFRIKFDRLIEIVNINEFIISSHPSSSRILMKLNAQRVKKKVLNFHRKTFFFVN